MKMFRLLKDHNPHLIYAKSAQFRMPILIWYRRGYEVCEDSFKTGFWRFEILLSLDIFRRCGMGLRLNYGWCLVKAYNVEYAQ